MQHFVHLFGSQEQISAAIIRNQKTKTIAMALNNPFYEFQFFGYTNIALAITDDLPFTNHRSQPATKEFGFFGCNIQQFQ